MPEKEKLRPVKTLTRKDRQEIISIASSTSEYSINRISRDLSIPRHRVYHYLKAFQTYKKNNYVRYDFTDAYINCEKCEKRTLPGYWHEPLCEQCESKIKPIVDGKLYKCNICSVEYPRYKMLTTNYNLSQDPKTCRACCKDRGTLGERKRLMAEIVGCIEDITELGKDEAEPVYGETLFNRDARIS